MIKLFLIGLLLWSMPVEGQIKSATLTASGLTCSMCSKSIYKALEQVVSVKAIDVDVEKSTFMIQFKEGVAISLDDVKDAVENAGFSVASLAVVATFKGEEVYNDVHINIGGSIFHFLNVPKKKLAGDVVLKVLDKNFLPKKDRQKYEKYTTMKCFETGVKAACCPAGTTTSNRIYHVTI